MSLERLIDYIKDRIDAVIGYPQETLDLEKEDQWARAFDDLCQVYKEDLEKILEEIQYIAYLLRSGKALIQRLVEKEVI